jgi:hypothetical protein
VFGYRLKIRRASARFGLKKVLFVVRLAELPELENHVRKYRPKQLAPQVKNTYSLPLKTNPKTKEKSPEKSQKKTTLKTRFKTLKK